MTIRMFYMFRPGDNLGMKEKKNIKNLHVATISEKGTTQLEGITV